MTAPALTAPSRAPTGISVLDTRLNGGFPRPSTLLLFSEKPTEKRLFAENFAIQGIRTGETVLYVDFFRSPALARNDLLRFGKYPEDRLRFVDAVSTSLLVPTTEKHVIRDLDRLGEIEEVIVTAIEQDRPSRVVIDSMDFLTDRFPKPAIMETWRRIIQAGHAAGSVVCFLFLNWTYFERDLAAIREMSDFVVEFQSSMRGGIVRNSLRISETAEGGITTNWIPYAFKDLFGVTVYFPKILVIGPYHAGKSTVVQSLAEHAISVERMGTTVAFDYGNVNLSGIEAELFGTPGQERFEFIFKIFAREVNGILLIVDATRPEDFPRAKHMLELVGPRVPYVVLGNKADLPGALDAASIARKMELSEEVPVLATVATEGKGLREALQILSEMIIGVR